MNRLMSIQHPIGLSISVHYHVKKVTKLSCSEFHFSHHLFIERFNDRIMCTMEARFMKPCYLHIKYAIKLLSVFKSIAGITEKDVTFLKDN